MAKLSVLKGATSVLVRVFIQDSSSAVGAGLTGLVYNSSGLVCYRMRDDDGNAGATAISLVTATRGTWTSGGFVEKDASNAPGWYEFGIPNAALATGSRSVDIHFKGATNQAPLPIEIALTGWDNQDAVRGGLTALPNAAANAAGGLPVSAAGGLDLDEMNVDIEAIQTVTDQFTAAQAEPSAVPAANATPLQKLAWMALLARNKITQTATTQLIKANDDSTTVGSSTVSDDATTFVRSKYS